MTSDISTPKQTAKRHGKYKRRKLVNDDDDDDNDGNDTPANDETEAQTPKKRNMSESPGAGGDADIQNSPTADTPTTVFLPLRKSRRKGKSQPATSLGKMPVDLAGPGYEGFAFVPVSDSQVRLVTLPNANAVSSSNLESPIKEGAGSTDGAGTTEGHSGNPLDDIVEAMESMVRDQEKEVAGETEKSTTTGACVLKSEAAPEQQQPTATKDAIGKFMIVGVDKSGSAGKRPKRKVSCEVCKIELCGNAALQEHIDSTHAVFLPTEQGRLEKRYACDTCNKTYRHFIDMKYHKRLHSGELPHLCSHCGKGFVRVSALNQHIALAHNPGMKCKECHKVFEHEEEYKKHITEVHKDSDLTCKECGKIFSSKLKLRNHFSYHHGKTSQCPHCCAQISFWYMKEHLKTHLGIKPYKCDLCSKRFISAAALKNHSHVHSAQRRYKCRICGVQFDLPCRAKEHARIHTGEKPYVCDTCGQAFARMGTLTRHRLRHTGEKPHTCLTCGKAYTDRAKCLKHIRRHHPEVKPYQCRICEAGFASKEAMEEHTLIHVDQPLQVNNHTITIHDESSMQMAIDSLDGVTHILTVDASVLAQGIEIPS